MKTIVLVAREMAGWAEAGGIKDVVRGQAMGFANLGWTVHVVLPLYGFLQPRVRTEGAPTWVGSSLHPTSPVPVRAWAHPEEGITIHFLETPRLLDKRSLYTYTAQDELQNPSHVRGQGFEDTWQVNLEYQWAAAAYLSTFDHAPSFVLAHDGHLGFLPAICQSVFPTFASTQFVLLIHNAGNGYRQEMPISGRVEDIIGLGPVEFRRSIIDGHSEPIASASHHARLLTVSENYAHELLTGQNDHWSGAFGRWLRSDHIELVGIINGLDLSDKDPRFPDEAGLPAGFDPLRNDWRGKELCRRSLREYLLLKPLQVHGRLVRWNDPLYVMQGRLTAQKGVDALIDLVSRALRETEVSSFLVMAQGERRYEERLIRLARDSLESGRFLFVNRFEDALERLVLAGADVFLMPSEYEPCGLSDLKAQLMGTLPLVHRVGGLTKIIDGKTGFSYEKGRHGGLWATFMRTLDLFQHQPQQWKAMQREAFRTVVEDFPWTRIIQERYEPWLTEHKAPSILSGISPT